VLDESTAYETVRVVVGVGLAVIVKVPGDVLPQWCSATKG
jgi:hypothetical protein